MCYELLDTEKNYFNILQAIVTVFQKPLEMLNYLDATEMKHIFGNVQPLVDVHEQIYSQLQNLIEIDWREENTIASVFIEHVCNKCFVFLFSFSPFARTGHLTRQPIDSSITDCVSGSLGLQFLCSFKHTRH